MTTTTAKAPQLLISPPAPPPPPQRQGTFPSEPSKSHGTRANMRKPHPPPPNHGPGNQFSNNFRGIPSPPPPPPSLPIIWNGVMPSRTEVFAPAGALGSLSAATTAAKSANKNDGADVPIRHANGRVENDDANNVSSHHFNKNQEADYRAAFSPNLKSYLNGPPARHRVAPEEDHPGRNYDKEKHNYDENNSHSANASFFEISSNSHSNYNGDSSDNANANDTTIQTNKHNLTDLLFSPTAGKQLRQRNNDGDPDHGVKIIHSIFSPQFQRQGRYKKAHEQECGRFRSATRENRNRHDGIGMTTLQPQTLDDSATMGMTVILGNRDGGIVEMDGTWDYYGGDSTIATWEEDEGAGLDFGLDASHFENGGKKHGEPLFEHDDTFAAGEKSVDSGCTGGIFDTHTHPSLLSSTDQSHPPVPQSKGHVADASPLSTTKMPSAYFDETNSAALQNHAFSKTPVSKKSTSSTGASNTPGSTDSEEFYTPTSKELNADKTPSSRKPPKGRVSVSFSFGEDNAVTPKSIDWRNESGLAPVGEEVDDDNVHGDDELGELDELRNQSTREPNSRYNGFGGVSIHCDDNTNDGRYDWDGIDDSRNHNGSIVSDLDESAVFQTPKQYGSDWTVDRDEDGVASELSREGNEDVLGDVAVYGQRCDDDAFSPLAVQPKSISQHPATDEKRKPFWNDSKLDNLTNTQTSKGRSTTSSTTFRFRDASFHLSPIPSSAGQNVSSHTIDSVESMSPPSSPSDVEIKSLTQIKLRAKNARGSYDPSAHVPQSRLLFPDANAGRGKILDGAQLGSASTLRVNELDSRLAAVASSISENMSGTLHSTRSNISTANDESMILGKNFGASLFQKSALSSSTERNPSTKATIPSPKQEVRSLSTMSSFEMSSSQDTSDAISALPSNISADFLKQCECADTLNEIVLKLSHKHGKYPNLLRLAEHRFKKVRSKQSAAVSILHNLASSEKIRYVQRDRKNVQRNPSPSSRAEAGVLDTSAPDSPPTASKLKTISPPESEYNSGSFQSVSRSDLKQQAIPSVVKGAPLPNSPSLLRNEMSLTLDSSSLDMNLSESLVLDEETVFWKHDSGNKGETVELALSEEGSRTEYTSKDRTHVKESYEELKEKLVRTLQSHDALTREVDSLVERYENKQRQFEHQVSKLNNENDRLRKEVQNLQENLENANKDAKNATHRLQAELERIKQKYSNLSLNQCDLERELKQVRFEHDKAKVEVARLQLSLQESQESKHRTENANTEMKEKLKEAYVARDAYAKELAVSTTDLGETTALKQVAENECRQLKAMNKQLEDKTNHMSAALREMHQRLADSRSYIENLHSLINGSQVASVEVESQFGRKEPDLSESNQKFTNLKDNYRQWNQRMNDYSGDKAVESIYDAARTSRITRQISPSTETNNENIKPCSLGGQAITGKQFHRIEAIKSFGGKKGLVEKYNSNRARRFGDKVHNLHNLNR